MDVNRPSLDDDLAELEGNDPAVKRAVDRLDEATTRILSTSAELRETQRALAALQADLTAARGTVVDLLQIIDAFQIESGADRNAAYADGIKAVCELRRERDDLIAFLRGTHEFAKERNQGREPDDLHLAYEREMARLRTEADLARAELVSVRAELEQQRGES